MFELEASEVSSSSSEKSSKFDALFTSEELVILEDFRSWLVVTEKFQKGSASSYVTNFKRARSKSKKSEALNSDERSARKKFESFRLKLAMQKSAELVENEL